MIKKTNLIDKLKGTGAKAVYTAMLIGTLGTQLGYSATNTKSVNPLYDELQTNISAIIGNIDVGTSDMSSLPKYIDPNEDFTFGPADTLYSYIDRNAKKMQEKYNVDATLARTIYLAITLDAFIEMGKIEEIKNKEIQISDLPTSRTDDFSSAFGEKGNEITDRFYTKEEIAKAKQNAYIEANKRCNSFKRFLAPYRVPTKHKDAIRAFVRSKMTGDSTFTSAGLAYALMDYIFDKPDSMRTKIKVKDFSYTRGELKRLRRFGDLIEFIHDNYEIEIPSTITDNSRLQMGSVTNKFFTAMQNLTGKGADYIKQKVGEGGTPSQPSTSQPAQGQTKKENTKQKNKGNNNSKQQNAPSSSFETGMVD